jgi:hypothetical protein
VSNTGIIGKMRKMRITDRTKIHTEAQAKLTIELHCISASGNGSL